MNEECMVADISARCLARRYEAVAVGGSSGGFEALQHVLSWLTPDFDLPIVTVLHRGPAADALLIRLLAQRCRLAVKEAEEKEPLCPGVVYLAPANYHLLVELDRTLSLSVDPKVCYSRPSIDVLLETAADAFEGNLVGILLTGANHDGTAGLKRIKTRGGLTIAQDPEDAQAELMPRSAIEAGVVERVLPLKEIGPFLAEIGCRPAFVDEKGFR